MIITVSRCSDGRLCHSNSGTIKPKRVVASSRSTSYLRSSHRSRLSFLMIATVLYDELGHAITLLWAGAALLGPKRKQQSRSFRKCMTPGRERIDENSRWVVVESERLRIPNAW